MNNLKPLQNELLALEKKLADDQRQWTIRKNRLSREVKRLEALIPDLEDKVRITNAELDKNRHELQGVIDDVNSQLEALQSISKHVNDKCIESDDLDISINTKTAQLTVIQEKIDNKLKAYEANRKSEIDKSLTQFTHTVDELKQEHEALSNKVQEARDEIAKLSAGAAELREDNRKIDQEENIKIKALRDEVESLIKERADTEEELKKLYREKASVAADTKKAEDRHKQFIQYETNARKELEAKNTALLKKQEDIGQQERFIKARRSILPEM